MRYGISIIAGIPMRSRASESSEMINQVLFGELFIETEKRGSWSKVVLESDNYEGWIDNKTPLFVNENQFEKLKLSPKTYIARHSAIANDGVNQIFLPMGSELLNYSEKNNEFEILAKTYKINPLINGIVGDSFEEKILSALEQFVNVPYLWGGKNSWGADCSGLVQTIFKLLNIKLPRDAKEQVFVGENVEFISHAKIGDLAFFDNKDGRINHVGIITGQGKITHCSGVVKTDIIDHQGIFDSFHRKYSHKLRVIKRISID